MPRCLIAVTEGTRRELGRPLIPCGFSLRYEPHEQLTLLALDVAQILVKSLSYYEQNISAGRFPKV